MGTFSIEIGVGGPGRDRWVTVDALVDTGATMTSMPGSVLRSLGVEPMAKKVFQFAQGEVRTMEVGQTWVRFQGQEIITQVLFNDEGTPPLLGALALEGALMGVDPVAQRLIPVRGLAMGVGLRRCAGISGGGGGCSR